MRTAGAGSGDWIQEDMDGYERGLSSNPTATAKCNRMVVRGLRRGLFRGGVGLMLGQSLPQRLQVVIDDCPALS